MSNRSASAPVSVSMHGERSCDVVCLSWKVEGLGILWGELSGLLRESEGECWRLLLDASRRYLAGFARKRSQSGHVIPNHGILRISRLISAFPVSRSVPLVLVSSVPPTVYQPHHGGQPSHSP